MTMINLDKVGQKLAKLKQERRKVDQKLRILQGRHRAQFNKQESKKRYVVGETVLEAAKRNPTIQAWLTNLLNGALHLDGERELFGLPNVESSQTTIASPPVGAPVTLPVPNHTDKPPSS
jgi:hypothetical protein